MADFEMMSNDVIELYASPRRSKDLIIINCGIIIFFLYFTYISYFIYCNK